MSGYKVLSVKFHLTKKTHYDKKYATIYYNITVTKTVSFCRSELAAEVAIASPSSIVLATVSSEAV